MKRIALSVIAMSALLCAGIAYADDQKTEVTTEKKTTDDGSTTKAEVKTKTDPGGMNNSATDDSVAEKKVKHDKKTGHTTTTTKQEAKHDAPGMKNDHKHSKETKTETDAAGNVVKQNTTEDAK